MTTKLAIVQPYENYHEKIPEMLFSCAINALSALTSLSLHVYQLSVHFLPHLVPALSGLEKLVCSNYKTYNKLFDSVSFLPSTLSRIRALTRCFIRKTGTSNGVPFLSFPPV